ncbi:hypothetical protein [Prevotella multiformis]
MHITKLCRNRVCRVECGREPAGVCRLRAGDSRLSGEGQADGIVRCLS